MDIITRIQAQSQQLTTYYTGVPCKYGHLAVRNTKDGSCYECCRIRSSKFRADRPDYAKSNYRNNVERYRQQTKEYYASHKEQYQQRNAEYYSTDEVYQQHLETCAKWRIRYKEQQRNHKAITFRQLAPTHIIPSVPAERDFKYWLAGKLIERGIVVYNEQYLDEERTSRIDLLIPGLMLGIECKLTSHNWSKAKVDTQRSRYQRLLEAQGYQVHVVSMDGSIGLSVNELFAIVDQIIQSPT